MRTLKKIINRYMLLLTFISVAIMLIIIGYSQVRTEQKHAYELSMKTFSQIEQVLEENRKELAEIQAAYRQECLNNAESIARIIEGDPEIIYHVEELKELAEIIGVDEIHFFDSTGRIFAGTHPEYYGYTFDSGEQMNFFKPMLTDRSLQLVQDITPNTAEGKLMQYSALWSQKEDIIVQVGMEPVSVMKVTEKNELSYIFSLFSVSPEANYYAIDAKSGKIVGATIPEYVGKTPQEIGLDFNKIKTQQEGFSAEVNGQQSYCVFKAVNENYLGRTISNSELYQRIPIMVFQLAACLTAIVLIISFAVTLYMNKFVVDKIQAVNAKLHSITMGNLDEVIDIQSSLEFWELSSYLNRMIKRLLDNNKKMSYVLNKTNLCIGIYEYNPSMKKVYFTEYLPQLLALDNAQMEQIASDYSQFKAVLDQIRQNPVPGEPGVFRLSEQPVQYLKLEEVNEQNDVFGVAIDVTKAITQRKKIEYERDMDLLTGLYNRRGLDSRLADLFQEPEQLGCSAFVMIDADGLKEVNDTYGHQRGDIYLKRISEIIRDFGPKSCIAARQGGDEFVLFLYQYESEEALIHTLQALEAIQNHRSACIDDTLCIPIRFSFGYCLTHDGTDYHAIIKEADKRMYQNKRERKRTRTKL